MNIVTSLIRGAMVSLKDVLLTETLCEASKALETCFGNIIGSLKESAPASEKEKECTDTDMDFSGIDALARPDAVWLYIYRRHPRVYDYPLGEITERAVKKTVNVIISRGSTYLYDDVDTSAHPGDNKIRDKLVGLMNPNSKDKILQIFLTHYFFEICIDQLRRPFKNDKKDWCYRYHFSRKGEAVSWAAEKKLRQELIYQCAGKAAIFLEYLQRALEINQEDFRKARLEIRKGFLKIFKFKLPFVPKSEPLPFVNVAVGNDLKQNAQGKYELVLGKEPLSYYRTKYDIYGKCRMFLFEHPRANVGVPYEKLETRLGREIQPMVKDLLEVGVAVYLSDLYTQRQKGLGRKIGLLMPLRNVSAWEGVKDDLERTVSFLGRDDFKIYLEKHEERAKKFKEPGHQSDKDCVCLFSGGLDSTAGAVWALENGLKPLFVSHYSNYKLGTIQKSIIRRLYEIYDRQMLSMRLTTQSLDKLRDLSVPYPIRRDLARIRDQSFVGDRAILDILRSTIGEGYTVRYLPAILKYSRELQHIGIFVSKPKNTLANPDKIWRPLGNPSQSVMAQHLRSFLFLSLASAVALEYGIKKIYVFENGPVAINPLFSEARVNTLTTHPHFLKSFESFINKLFNVDLSIENPFLYMSKGEVAGILSKPRLKGLTALTDSCWNWFKVAVIASNELMNWCGETHDGECVPCIIRRAAVNCAGLWDDDTKYLTDVFQEYPHLSIDIMVIAADYLRFCHNVNGLKDEELLHYAPDFSVFEAGVDSGKLTQMYRKHAKEIVGCFQARANDSFKRDFAAVLS
jgi:7-cyano-7-deazaguanine synthase in queuosine biosynthesis